MGFWIFMFVSSLMVPFLMIGFGKWFQNHPPKQINPVYGYRTKMSRINMDTWNYAHKYFGKMWLRTGCLLLLFTVSGMIFGFKKSEDVVGIIGGVVVTVQVIVLMLPVLWTERELRRRFEPDGRRKMVKN